MQSLVTLPLWFSLLASCRAFPCEMSDSSVSSLLDSNHVISMATPSAPQSVSCSGPLNFGCYQRRFVTYTSPTDGDSIPPYLIAIIAIIACGIFASVIISIVRCSNRTSSDQTGESSGVRRRHHDALNHHDQMMSMNNQIAMQNMATASAPAQCTGGGGYSASGAC